MIETGEIKIAVDTQSLCVSLTYKINQKQLTTDAGDDFAPVWSPVK